MNEHTPNQSGPQAPHGPAEASQNPGGPQAGPSSDRFFRWIRDQGIIRADDRWIGGVAAGIAHRWKIDPLVARAMTAVALLFTGIGWVIYAAAWALLPDGRDGRIHAQELLRGRFDAAYVGIGIFAIVGGAWGNDWFGIAPFASGSAWRIIAAITSAGISIALVAAVAILVIRAAQRDRGPQPVGAQHSMPNSAGNASNVGTTPAGAGPSNAGRTGPQPAAAHQHSTGSGWTTTSDDATAAPVGSGPASTPDGTDATGPLPLSDAADSAAYAGPQPPHWGGHESDRPVPPPPSAVKPVPAGPQWRTLPARLFALIFGLTLISVAAVLVAHNNGLFDGNVTPIAVGTALCMLGVGMTLCGVFGRTAGSLGSLVLIAALVAGPTVAWASLTDGTDSPALASFSTTTWSPTNAESAGRGYVTMLGTATIDLTELPARAGTTIEIPVRVAAGTVTILVPQGAAVTAQTRIVAGDFDWLFPGSGREEDGLVNVSTVESPAVTEGATAQFHLDIRGTAGTVSVEQTNDLS